MGIGGALYKSAVGLDAVQGISAPAFAKLREIAGDQVGGVVVDQSGAVVPGAVVTVTREGFNQAAVTDVNGTFIISRVPPGALAVSTSLPGFGSASVDLPASEHRTATIALQPAAVSESVQITHDNVIRRDLVSAQSMNVQSLQRRVAGVLPVRIDVPRAGRSFVFVRPLVVDEPTTMRFEYKAR